MYLFQFVSTVCSKVAISNPTNYIFLRSAINTLSYKKSIFPKLKNRAGIPTCSVYLFQNECPLILVQLHTIEVTT